jgi:uncharacterized protein DUF3795
MPLNPEFISPCGLYCGVCAIHIAHRDENEKFKASLVGLYQGGVAGKGTLPNGQTLTTDAIQCQGCRSNNLFMHCKQCEIRDCTEHKEISGCHKCDEFPCTYIENFPMAVGKKVILRSVPYRKKFGTEKWIKNEESRYFCPECGNKVFRGVVKCNQCKTMLDLD